MIAYAVSQRTREIGVRVALGAEVRDIRALVVRDASLLALPGLIIGLAGATLAGRTIQRFLYGVSTGDLPTYAAITIVLGVVILMAAYLPARRATRIDPVEALRAG